MTLLSVNVNKLATLRNSRGKNIPDVEALSTKILLYGAHGLTVHPRPDGRHIRPHDVHALSALVRNSPATSAGPVEFNIEGYPSPDFLKLIEDVHPDQATLVPDPPEALTSNAGWNLRSNETFLASAIARIKSSGARVSLFLSPFSFNDEDLKALQRLQPDRIELYTEKFADDFDSDQSEATVAAYAHIAKRAEDCGIGVNAGHDLNQKNLGYLIQKIPSICEVSIGHALISEALEQGLETTVKNYLQILANAQNLHAQRP